MTDRDVTRPNARPVVKWVGGKTKLLPELLARLPAAWNRYYEPFAGGAALFFKLAPERAVLNDLNADLIGLYRALAEQPEAVLGVLGRLEELHSEEHYYRTRDEFNQHPGAPDPHDRAAAFLYLNRACFNGLWRVNSAGSMNAAVGRNSKGELNRVSFDLDHLRAAAAAIARADIRCGDYRAAVHDSRAGDLVYFDPPYVPVSETANYTSYTADGFGQEQQEDLAELARDLTERGVHVLASNSDAPLVRRLYDWARVDVVQRPGTVSCKGSKRGEVNEVIAVGDPAAAMRAPRRARRPVQMDLLAMEVSHG